jgi:hypothetical protein
VSASQDWARKIYNEGHDEREGGRINAGMPASWTRARVSAGWRARASGPSRLSAAREAPAPRSEAAALISQRPKLRPATVDHYRWLLKKHIVIDQGPRTIKAQHQDSYPGLGLRAWSG